jgi:hypothetical protein
MPTKLRLKIDLLRKYVNWKNVPYFEFEETTDDKDQSIIILKYNEKYKVSLAPRKAIYLGTVKDLDTKLGAKHSFKKLETNSKTLYINLDKILSVEELNSEKSTTKLNIYFNFVDGSRLHTYLDLEYWRWWSQNFL